MRIAVVVSILGLMSVARADSTVPSGGAPAAGSASPYAGRYQLSGRTLSDECASRIVLAARKIVIEPAGDWLEADVVGRRYAAHLERGELVADGAFHEQRARLWERWRLRHDGDRLRGTLETSWLLPGDDAPCSVVFELQATPLSSTAGR